MRYVIKATLKKHPRRKNYWTNKDIQEELCSNPNNATIYTSKKKAQSDADLFNSQWKPGFIKFTIEKL